MASSLYSTCLVQATATPGGTTAHTVVRGIAVYDVSVYSSGTNAGGLLTVKKAATAVTDDIACDTQNAVTRVLTMTAAQVSFAAGDTMNFVSQNAAAGVATVYGIITGSGV